MQHCELAEFGTIYQHSLQLIIYCNMLGSVVLNEGDSVTFGHMSGQLLKPGTRMRQPESEYQFLVSFWLLLLYQDDCINDGNLRAIKFEIRQF